MSIISSNVGARMIKLKNAQVHIISIRNQSNIIWL